MDISGHRGTKPKPTDAIPPARSGVPYPADPYGERLRKAEERLAKMESAVADLKRRTEPHAPVALRFLGQLAEEPSAGEPRETR